MSISSEASSKVKRPFLTKSEHKAIFRLADAVSESLPEWLSETSQMGCGDDITMLVAYYEKEKTDTDTNLN